MRKFGMAVCCLFGLLLYTTSAGDGMQRLVSGSWVGDADKAIEQQGPTVAPDDPMVQMLTAMLSGLNCTFGENSVHMEMEMFGEQQVVDAGIEVLEDTGDAITIKNTDGEKMGAVSVITFLDEDHIQITEDTPGAPALFLKRVGGQDAADMTAEELAAQAPDAEDAAFVAVVEEEPAEPRFLVIIPEQIDTEWFWYYYTEVSQNIVQAAVEKALVKQGLDVVDLATVSMFGQPGSVEDVLNKTGALNAAQASGATYLILGKATAVMQGRSVAYGLEVIRSKAQASVKIIRVADGKVLDMEDAEAEEGGQVQKATGLAALKAVGKDLGKRVARAAEKALANE
ncbi:MAG: hypothetical protein PHP44_12735 [Kiritimatiellae bacterium]|nr:hypothetical protein [Kiritimatiellia bacterium]MDD4736957.1 hypothetical protein [Kiritimatiellia bacterium]